MLMSSPLTFLIVFWLLYNFVSRLEDYKYRGAVKKYQSQSQHKKLAYEKHVQEENFIKAENVLRAWVL